MAYCVPGTCKRLAEAEARISDLESQLLMEEQIRADAEVRLAALQTGAPSAGSSAINGPPMAEPVTDAERAMWHRLCIKKDDRIAALEKALADASRAAGRDEAERQRLEAENARLKAAKLRYYKAWRGAWEAPEHEIDPPHGVG